mmetsp:Transcript_59057/g.169588  ORF Transcript_59057/g.169588 Transcript_59057/m.169588 type:complete len:217 (-) Transcript_59057:495-1145(-)
MCSFASAVKPAGASGMLTTETSGPDDFLPPDAAAALASWSFFSAAWTCASAFWALSVASFNLELSWSRSCCPFCSCRSSSAIFFLSSKLVPAAAGAPFSFLPSSSWTCFSCCSSSSMRVLSSGRCSGGPLAAGAFGGGWSLLWGAAKSLSACPEALYSAMAAAAARSSASLTICLNSWFFACMAASRFVSFSIASRDCASSAACCNFAALATASAC